MTASGSTSAPGRRGAIAALAAVATMALAPLAARAQALAEQLVTLPLPRGAQQAYVLAAPDGARAVAVLFTGGDGTVGLLRHGIPRPGKNFLLRERHRLQAAGIATAVVDAPSDQPAMSDGWRSGERHAEDIAAVLADLRTRLPGRPLFLVGTSRGTVSAAYVGRALAGQVAGVVLSSTAFNATRRGSGVSALDLAALGPPVLLVHHVDDACVATPHAGAQRWAERGLPLVSIDGGLPPQSDACEPFAPHGFYGVEARAMGAIGEWMLAQAARR